jgi:hypothetical protein
VPRKTNTTPPTESEVVDTTTPPTPAVPNPFDPAALRLRTDFGKDLGVKKQILTIPVRKPSKQEFFQTHPDAAYRLETAVLEDEADGRTVYLVAQELWQALAGEITPAVLFTCINRQGDLFVWRAKMPADDGRSNLWTESALRIAERAQARWVRMRSNMAAGLSDCHEAPADLSAPEWPDLSFPQILEIAFRGNLIQSLEHPVVRKIAGLA